MKILVVGFEDSVLSPAILALKAQGHEVVRWIATTNDKKLIRDHGIEDLGEWSSLSKALSLPIPIIGLDELEKLRSLESTYLSITDRLSYHPISVKQRLRAYHSLLGYWRDWWNGQHVDVMLFSSTPHMGWDNVAWELGRMRGVRGFILERTGIADRLMWLTEIHFKETIPTDFTSGSIDPELEKAVAAQDAWVKLAREMNQKTLSQKFIKRILRRCYNLAITLLSPRQYFKTSSLSALAMSTVEEIPKWKADIIQWKESRLKIQLRNAYKRLCKTISQDSPYIFFPLHYQPERTSLPLARDFHDQELAASMIANQLPDGWKLVIKEHPRQFDSQRIILKTKHFRTIDDFARLAKLPNTILISEEESANALIQNARAVVTLTGTSGWDSLKASVPVVAFGTPWYGPCRSCYRISNLKELKLSMNAISSTSPQIVKNHLQEFLTWVSPRLFKASNSAFYARFSDTEGGAAALGKGLIEATNQILREEV